MSPKMRASISRSARAFDAEILAYFQTTTRYRSQSRRGSVVIIDRSEELHEFLRDLSERCGIDAQVFRFDDVEAAQSMVCQLGSNGVKVVIVNSDMLGGDPSLIHWFNAEFPDIPVWVSEFPQDSEALQGTAARVGIIRKGVPFSGYADIMGFPHPAMSGQISCAARA